MILGRDGQSGGDRMDLSVGCVRASTPNASPPDSALMRHALRTDPSYKLIFLFGERGLWVTEERTVVISDGRGTVSQLKPTPLF